MDEPRPYPRHREADVALRDGSTVHVRPVRREDEAALGRFLADLSEQSRYLRFFSGGVDLDAQARWAADVDYRDRFGLVATAGPEGTVVAHAVWLRTGSDHAEVALAVADALQGRGVGTILLGQLAETAAEAGVAVFEARVLPMNRRMIEVFRESGFPTNIRSELGETLVDFPTSLTSEALERFEAREQVAAVAAMRRFLVPRSVAVIGASRSRGTIGGEVFHNLLSFGFNGPVFPVNPSAEVVQSVTAFPSVEAIPGPVDLAVIVVPAARVVEAARECGRKGVRALVVISSGFAEVGEEGRARQRRAPRRLPRVRHAADRAELHGDRERGPGGQAQRDVRAGGAAARTGGVPVPERCAGPGGDRLRAVPRASASRPSSRWGTRPTSRGTTSSTTGSRTPTPT